MDKLDTVWLAEQDLLGRCTNCALFNYQDHTDIMCIYCHGTRKRSDQEITKLQIMRSTRAIYEKYKY